MFNINQITLKLNEINNNLFDTIKLLKLYFETGELSSVNYDRLNVLTQKIDYDSLVDTIKPLQDDEILINNIVNAVFFELWAFSIDFLETDCYDLINNKYNEYVKLIINHGNDIDFYLNALACLDYNLNKLHLFFLMFGIPFSNNWSVQKYGVNLNFNDLLLFIQKEKDLIKRKNIVMKKLHSVELLILKDSIDHEDLIHFENYIDKCKKAIESLNFQGINSANNTSNLSINTNLTNDNAKLNINKIELILGHIDNLGTLNLEINTDKNIVNAKQEDYESYTLRKEVEKAITLLFIEGDIEALKRIKLLIEMKLKDFKYEASGFLMKFPEGDVFAEPDVIQFIYDTNREHLNDLLEIINPYISNNITEIPNSVQSSITSTILDTYNVSLNKYNFFKLSLVSKLSADNQQKLIHLISVNCIPYKIAMLDFLGFFKHLENEKLLTKTAIYKIISTLFDCSTDAVKGNMLALNDYSKIDKDRYTSHLHKVNVKTDYYSLK